MFGTTMTHNAYISVSIVTLCRDNVPKFIIAYYSFIMSHYNRNLRRIKLSSATSSIISEGVRKTRRVRDVTWKMPGSYPPGGETVSESGVRGILTVSRAAHEIGFANLVGIRDALRNRSHRLRTYKTRNNVPYLRWSPIRRFSAAS